jgi:hypothetical protein
MRDCDPRLNALTDAEISEIMALDDPDACADPDAHRIDAHVMQASNDRVPED